VIWVWDSQKWVSGTLTTGIYAPITNDVGRNYIHNSMFNIAQRGNAGFTATAYTLDRWLLVTVGDAVNFGRVANPSVMGGDDSATWVAAMAITGSGAAGSYTRVAQPIEDVRRLSNKTVTVSFYAIANAAQKLGVSFDQYFGTGGSPSATVNGTGQSVMLTGSWARYSMTFAIPSMLAKTVGTNGDHSTYMNIWYSSGSTNNTFAGGVGVAPSSSNINLWGVQLELGTVATPLEKRDPVYELQQCQRFYFNGQITTGLYQVAGQAANTTVMFPVTMRANPVMVLSNNFSTNCSTPTLNSAVLGSTGFTASANATATGTMMINLYYTASADL
jgi:hypothetical protein